MRLYQRAGVTANERAVAVAFALIVVGSVIFEASHAWFWQRSHDVAPVAAVLLLFFVVALLRGYRWAWWFFLIISVTGLVTWVTDGTHGLTVGTVAGFLVGLIEVALLLSAPMRRYVHASS